MLFWLLSWEITWIIQLCLTASSGVHGTRRRGVGHIDSRWIDLMVDYWLSSELCHCPHLFWGQDGHIRDAALPCRDGCKIVKPLLRGYNAAFGIFCVQPGSHHTLVQWNLGCTMKIPSPGHRHPSITSKPQITTIPGIPNFHFYTRSHNILIPWKLG